MEPSPIRNEFVPSLQEKAHGTQMNDHKRLSEQYDNKSVWYILYCLCWGKIVKHGTTYHVTNRKGPYNEHSPYPVQYKAVFFLDKNDLDTKGIPLYSLDNKVFPAWLATKGMADTRVQENAGEEFYQHENPEALVKEFLAAKGIRIIEEMYVDIFPKLRLNSAEKKQLLDEDEEREMLREDIPLNDSIPLISSSKNSELDVSIDNIEKTFLKREQHLRRNQRELYDLFSGKLETCVSYTGIVHWATGTGKTIGEIILILLCFNFMKKNDKIYRGLLVTHKNDIIATQRETLEKLKLFGLKVIFANNGQFSKLRESIPKDEHVLIIVIHAALVGSTKELKELDDVDSSFMKQSMDYLPPINHFNYDEVHRLPGAKFYDIIKRKLQEWETPFCTGMSATPKTSNDEQRMKMQEFFQDPKPLHTVTIEEAVNEGLIANPRFHITELPSYTNAHRQSPEQIKKDKQQHDVCGVISRIKTFIQERITASLCKKGKGIIWLSTIDEIVMAVVFSKELFPAEWKIYVANPERKELENELTDEDFVKADADGTPRILFACDKYREGADIEGLEFTGVLMGKTMAAYILLQMIGRALRMDYEGKEGWCCIFRPKYEDESDTTVLDTILLEMISYCSNSSFGLANKEVEDFIRRYFGTIEVNGEPLGREESLRWAQNMFLRKLHTEGRLKMSDVAKLCQDNNIIDSASYGRFCRDKFPHIPTAPSEYWKRDWVSMYDFLHGSKGKMSLETFIQDIIKGKGLRTAEEWETQQSNFTEYPTLQCIVDGYFDSIANFKDIVEKSGLRGRR